jgi:hypothetical protein
MWVALFSCPIMFMSCAAGDRCKIAGHMDQDVESVTARSPAKELNLRPPIWQQNTFDHVLRGKESHDEKWNYVRENPVRAGLCAQRPIGRGRERFTRSS